MVEREARAWTGSTPLQLIVRDEPVAAVVHLLAAVADEEPREARAREREAELQLAAARVRLADVADDEARLLSDRPRPSRRRATA